MAAGRLSPKHYPVLVAYALGLLLGSSGWLTEADHRTIDAAMRTSVAVAIPALLLQSHVRQLRAVGCAGLLAGLCLWVGAATAAAGMVALLGQTPAEAALSLAIFTGSLANLQAAGLALDISGTTLVAANLGDVVAGGLLFLLLTSIGPGLVGRVLRKRHRRTRTLQDEGAPAPLPAAIVLRPRHWMAATLLSVGALAVGLLLEAVVPVSPLPAELLILGGATAAAVICASAIVRARVAAAGTRLGEGLMIAFCVLVGTAASLGDLYGEALAWAWHMGAFLLIELSVALALARACGVDVGTFLLAVAGAVYSPAFVGPVAHAARRPDLVAVGVLWGLVGLALGTPAALAFVAVVGRLTGAT